jgi:glycosyltransferase involved in cell wall biosynthesis
MESRSLAVLHTNFHRGWGGQPARILMLCIGLSRRGHRALLAAPEGSVLARRAREAGIETFEEARFLPTRRWLAALRDAGRLSRLLRGGRFDLVDCHGSQDLWATVAARRWAGIRIPLVFTRHNTKRVADHALNRYLYRRCVDHLIVAGGAVLDRYEGFLRRGDLRRERISIVHSAYWEDRFHAGVDGSAVRREIAGEDTEAALVGVVGRLVPDKGGVFFLRAAARLAEEFPRARYLFVGQGTAEKDLRAAAQDLGIGDRVMFLGFREDVPEVTAALDVSVLPSIDCDASSAVLKEAMAVGRPVVATRIGGAEEIVADGETGLLVPPGDDAALAAAIRSILLRPDRGRGMGERGRGRVGAFGRERLVEGTLEAYRRVLARRAL